MADIVQLRRDTETNWNNANPILADGEVGFAIDADIVKMKVGHSLKRWNALNYFGGDSTGDKSIDGGSYSDIYVIGEFGIDGGSY